jgi:glutamyl-Q tRNA(Asp) synthetase
LRTLEGFGFEWDGEVVVQSRRLDHYHAALVRLQLDGDVYPCACSRSEIAAATSRVSVDGGRVYPGTCRNGLADGKAARAWRMRVPDRDFVLFRADGQYAYQLAVVVDDAMQGISAVVRGVDLLDSTARQMWLQQRLGLPTPSYLHLPVVVNAAGEKLSKQTQAPAVDSTHGSIPLAGAMRFLGQTVPDELCGVAVADFWRWAVTAWSPDRIPAVRGIFPGGDGQGVSGPPD